MYIYTHAHVQLIGHAGHIVTPYFRFLTKSGDWVWMQMENITHFKKGTNIPEYYEYKTRVMRYFEELVSLYTLLIKFSLSLTHTQSRRNEVH